jgi:hypothetical protein
MTRIHVDPGICGLCATVDALRTGKRECRVTIESACEKVKTFAAQLDKVTLADILPRHLNRSAVYEKAGQCELHGSCPIPCAVIKAAEAEMELALRKNIMITFKEYS